MWLDHGATEIHAFEPVPWIYARMADSWAYDKQIRMNWLAPSIEGCSLFRREVGRRIYNRTSAKYRGRIREGRLRQAIRILLQHPRPICESGRSTSEELTLSNSMSTGEHTSCWGGEKTLSRFMPPIMIEISYLPRLLGESCERMIDWSGTAMLFALWTVKPAETRSSLWKAIPGALVST